MHSGCVAQLPTRSYQRGHLVQTLLEAQLRHLRHRHLCPVVRHLSRQIRRQTELCRIDLLAFVARRGRVLQHLDLSACRSDVPPTRTSIFAMGAANPRGPHHSFTSSDSVHACHNRSIGASNMRVTTRSRGAAHHVPIHAAGAKIDLADRDTPGGIGSMVSEAPQVAIGRLTVSASRA
jgi:hypothetical protein